MTNQALINKHVWKGYNKAALRLGTKFVQYRPRSAGPVIVDDNIVAEYFMATDRSDSFGFVKPKEYDDSIYYALLDLTYVQPGDYLTDYNQTFFVAWIESIKPAELVLCNRVINVYRPETNNGYGGNTGPRALITGWPCSILPGTKGEVSVAGLPGAVRAPWLDIKVPKPVGININPFDLIIDDLNRRYILSDVSDAKEGYHITCSYESG